MQKEAESECTGLEVPSSFTANVWEVRPLPSSPWHWNKSLLPDSLNTGAAHKRPIYRSGGTSSYNAACHGITRPPHQTVLVHMRKGVVSANARGCRSEGCACASDASSLNVCTPAGQVQGRGCGEQGPGDCRPGSHEDGVSRHCSRCRPGVRILCILISANYVCFRCPKHERPQGVMFVFVTLLAACASKNTGAAVRKGAVHVLTSVYHSQSSSCLVGNAS